MLHLAETLAYFLATWILIPVVSALPLPAALAVGRGLGRICFHVLRLRRGVAIRNLRHVLGETHSEAELVAMAGESYAHLGMMLIEVLRSLSNSDDSASLVDVPQIEQLEALIKEGRGVIVCSPHYGSFERMAFAAAARGLPISAVMRPLENERFNALVVDCRARAGVEVLQRGKASPYALLERLKEGALLGLLPDQNTRHGVRADFLGKPARTYRGPAVLHLRSGSPIAVCLNRRDRDDPTRHHVSIRTLPVHTPTPDREADVAAITRSICDAMSEEILRDPAQYLWVHRRWGRDPAGSKARRGRLH